MLRKSVALVGLTLLTLGAGATAPAQMQAAIEAAIASVQEKADPENRFEALFLPGTKLLSVDDSGSTVTLVFNERLGTRPWSPEEAVELMQALQKAAGTAKPVEVRLRYRNAPGGPKDLSLRDHTTDPALVRERATDRKAKPLAFPVVQRPDYKGPEITRGLLGRHLVMGPSHGNTWHEGARWQYQRARLWTIIEDLYPLAYINPFITPMLENAGANVFSVRERDWQTAEVIVDFPEAFPNSYTVATGTWRTVAGGWRGGIIASLPPELEPFREGTSAVAEVGAEASTLTYVPDVPRAGRYAVYASWQQSALNSPSVPVTVRHLGGSTTFRVNQQVAGATWVYLGHFEFVPGADPAKGSVIVTTEGAAPSPEAVRRTEAAAKEATEGTPKPVATTVSIDAIRIGGGMANGAPEGLTSGDPRYTEAARYYLQYSGAPRDLIYLLDASAGHFGVDYNRDIVARAEWPNFLTGAPSGPNAKRDHRGLGVPIDAYLAFHTDAGIDKTGVFGTLMLSRIWDMEDSDRFPDGRSRLLNRDLANMMADEIVRTARANYTSTWERRAHEDRGFGEIRRPNVPSVILELLSHQNFNDMKYGLDPRFKFDMSRAIYKSMLRFIAWQDGIDPVVQPLAPVNFRVQQDGRGGAVLTWEPQEDPLEPSATPTGYILYASRDGRSFDNGTFVSNASVALKELPEATMLAWRVTAVNEGGESFPTATLAMRWEAGKQPVLVVDGFDRVSGPAIVENGKVRGFDRTIDPGVPYHYNYGLVGDVYDFNPDSEWANDLEETGWGASTNLMEEHLEKGNTFDHSVGHGALLAAQGHAFDSTTLEGFGALNRQDLAAYPLTVWIAGRQRTVEPPAGLPAHGAPDRMKPAFALMTDEDATRLLEYVKGGGRLFMSGAHVAEELTRVAGSPRARLAQEVFGLTTHSVRRGVPAVQSTESGPFGGVPTFRYGVDLGIRKNLEPTVYPVPTVEILAGGEGSGLAYGPGENAALVRPNAILLGFPLDSVLPPATRADLLKRSIAHLKGK